MRLPPLVLIENLADPNFTGLPLAEGELDLPDEECEIEASE